MIDTEYWTEHHYSGHIFLIKSDEPASKWDGYCQFILQYRTIFGTSWSPDTVEAIQPPTDAVRFNNIAASGRVKSERSPKALKGTSKVIPPVPGEKPLEGRTEGSETVLAFGGNSGTTLDDALWESGHYRGRCQKCGNGIKRSGKRGRPRTIHKECR